MSKDEIKDIPLRELIRLQMSMTEQLVVAIAKIETHNEYTQKTINEHDKDINLLKDFRSNQRGAFAVLGFLGVTFIVDFLRRIIN